MTSISLFVPLITFTFTTYKFVAIAKLVEIKKALQQKFKIHKVFESVRFQVAFVDISLSILYVLSLIVTSKIISNDNDDAIFDDDDFNFACLKYD